MSGVLLPETLVESWDESLRDVEIDGVDGNVENGEEEYRECVAAGGLCRNHP